MAVAQGSYKVTVDKVKKVLKLEFSGFFRKGEGEAFYGEYEDAKKQLNKSETTLLIDGKDLQTFTPDKKEANIAFYKDYAGFKEVLIVAPESAVARIQLESYLKEAGVFEKFKFVNKLPM